MQRTLTVIIALCVLLGAVSAHELRHSGAQFSFVPERGFHRVVAPDFFSGGLPGHPELPVRYLTYILPPGVRADSVRFEHQDYSFLGSYYLYPAQPSVPLRSVPPWVDPDSVVYNSESPYPAAPVEIVHRGFFDGAGVVTVAVHPLRYIPVRREVYVASRVEFDFHTSEARPRVKPRVRGIHAQRTYDQALRAVIENRLDIPAYYQTPMLVPEQPPDAPGPVPTPSGYTIITNDELASAFQPYADWLTDKGVPASVIRLSQFLHSFPGVDDAEMLRNYLIDGYQYHGLVWVLLGGGHGIVPFRYGWTVDDSIPPPGNNSSLVAPSDLYFSDLEGNWDADVLGPDGRWGEPTHDSVDIYPQVFVGRLTVQEPEEVENWVNKTLYYEKHGSKDLTQFNRATWIYNTEFAPHSRTRAAFPPHFTHTDHNSVWASVARDAFGRTPGAIGPPVHASGIYNINCHGSPRNFVSKHGGGEWWKVWSVNPYPEGEYYAGLQYCDLDSNHYIVYDIGCYTAAFDSFVSHVHGSTTWHPADTIMTDAYTHLYPTTLGIAHLGNTRLGTYPVSLELQRDFWRLFFEHQMHAPAAALGVAQGLSKLSLNPVLRWHYYAIHAHNLFGSPELEPWMVSPGTMVVQAPSYIPQGVPVLFQVEVADMSQEPPVYLSGVRICLHKPDDFYEVGMTNSSGIAEFVVCAETPGEILITCTYPRTGNLQYLPRQEGCVVIPADDGPMSVETGLPQQLGFTAVGPSPAFRALTVQYGVPVPGRVRLLLYDVQGRRAAVARDEVLDPGYYRQDISTRALSLPPGVYFLVLAQDGNQVTGKVTLVE